MVVDSRSSHVAGFTLCSLVLLSTEQLLQTSTAVSSPPRLLSLCQPSFSSSSSFVSSLPFSCGSSPTPRRLPSLCSPLLLSDPSLSLIITPVVFCRVSSCDARFSLSSSFFIRSDNAELGWSCFRNDCWQRSCFISPSRQSVFAEFTESYRWVWISSYLKQSSDVCKSFIINHQNEPEIKLASVCGLLPGINIYISNFCFSGKHLSELDEISKVVTMQRRLTCPETPDNPNNELQQWTHRFSTQSDSLTSDMSSSPPH